MGKLVRFSISIEERLLSSFDELVRERGYQNRSEAIRDAIRRQLIHQEWEVGEEVAGVITLLYDHHRPGLSEALTQIQHHALPQVISTTHVHLDESNCLECIAVRGEARTIEALADRLKSLKGVKHGELTATSTGKKLV
ncbi:nickel-responsive transcriptional regulator NikR [Candidatus Bipolaricaulota bacterium]|nr:nickel-responsive transcriptional regulator NikR [Candidatus Bipolaricaulota bacterium]